MEMRERTAFAPRNGVRGGWRGIWGAFNGIPMPEGLEQCRSRPFFNRAQGTRFDVRAQDGVTEIDIYDEIGFFGIDARQVRQQLRHAADVLVRINSPGGDVFDGIAIHNEFADHPGRVTVQVTGIAASAASIIAMAGDEIRMAENSFLMIHNAWGFAVGESGDMLKMSEILGKIDGALAATYAARTGLKQAAVAAMMAAETWLTAEEAVDQGFADATSGEADASAAFDLSGFKNTPSAVPVAAPDAGARPGAPTVRDIERTLMRDAGLTRSKAQALLRQGYDALQDGTRDAAGDAATIEALRGLNSKLKELTPC